jgi:hypothetical protein
VFVNSRLEHPHPSPPILWRWKLNRGPPSITFMFFIQSWTIFIVIEIGYTHMPNFTLGCWCQLSFGQEWTHCLKNIAHFAKRAGTIRVQEDSRYIPKWESAFRLCILHLQLYCSKPLEPQNWPEWTTTHQLTIHWMPVMTPLSMNLNRVISGFTLLTHSVRNGLYM